MYLAQMLSFLKLLQLYGRVTFCWCSILSVGCEFVTLGAGTALLSQRGYIDVSTLHRYIDLPV